MIIEWKKRAGKESVFVDGRQVELLLLQPFPTHVELKYRFLKEDKLYNRAFSTSFVLEATKTKRKIELRNELPSSEWLWARQIKRGVII